jgi:pimeloyl-ACP methyl ester carboxylesterase
MPGERLLVMLHGAHFAADDFVAQGIVAALHQYAPDIQAVAATLTEGDYLEGDVHVRLHAQVIAPALARGVRQVWLLGISLGGMGALLYARGALAPLAGVILLSPFLATRGVIAEITAAGGLAAWRPGPPPPGDIERRLMLWLASPGFASLAPRVHLGCGEQDRFAPASRLLAARLPPGQVTATQGGHDWPTWRELWSRILATQPFGP